MRSETMINQMNVLKMRSNGSGETGEENRSVYPKILFTSFTKEATLSRK
jgi:hypothetical protein